jgi:hypothetical protein
MEAVAPPQIERKVRRFIIDDRADAIAADKPLPYP